MKQYANKKLKTKNNSKKQTLLTTTKSVILIGF